MTRLSDENIRGRTVVASDGLAIGEIRTLQIDHHAWRVASLGVELHADIADRLGVDRNFFQAGSIAIPVRMVGAVGDTVALTVPVDELRSILPSASERPGHDDGYPPLISSRSPSYERAQREFLHHAPAGGAQVVALLARLSEAEQNASDACEAIAGSVSIESVATQLHDDAEKHRARREALGKLIEALGGSAPRPAECREILTQAANAVASARSDVDAIHALRVMRGELGTTYAEAMRSPNLSDAQRASLAGLAPSVRAL